MKTQQNFVLFLALCAAALATSAVAQEKTQINDRENARVEFATFDPSEAASLLQQTDWDDHRCDGDHDRDDRNCYYRDRDRDRDWNRNQYYRGNSYYGGGHNVNGWYDRKGNFYPAGGNGYYDKHGKWHFLNAGGNRDRDDRW